LGKCLLIKERKFSATFVFTFLLYGGLYQIMFLDRVRLLDLLLSVSFPYLRLVLKLLCFSASSYKGTAESKLGLSEEREDIRLLINFGSCLIIYGG
jgi:hypothetical protein